MNCSIERRGGQLSRSELSPELQVLLRRFETHLKKGELGPMPAQSSAMIYMQMGQLELSMDDMDAEGMRQFLEWTRELGTSSSLIGQMVGSTLGVNALERCRAEPGLRPDSIAAEPPVVEEFFFGLCREFVNADQQRSQGNTSFSGLPGGPNSELLTQVMRRAFANNAIEFYPQRKAPDGFIVRPRSDVPGGFESWLLSKFGSHEDYTKRLEGYFAPATAHLRWVNFVETWDEVLGA
jgi:hypothetical protein